jgi:choline-sulfatase
LAHQRARASQPLLFSASRGANLFRYLKQNGYDVFWYGKNDALAAQSFGDSVTYWNEPDIFALLAAAVRGGGKSPLAPPWPPNDPHYFSFLHNEGSDRRQTPDYHQLSSAIKVFERSEGDRPFCIFLPLNSPHPPYSGPQGFHDLYDSADLPPLRPVGLPNKPNFHAGIREAYNLSSLTDADFRKIRSVYLGMVSYTDWLLGELLEAVERTHRTDDTAIFVLSDHGDYTGDYGLVEKWPSGLEDNLTQIPLIARVPGGVQGHVCENLVELYDVMATCLELANVEAQHTHFARSLMPQLHGGPGDPDRAAFAEGGYNIYEPQCFENNIADPHQIYYPKEHLEVTHPEMVSRAAMVRTHTHKLILRPSGQSELYAYKDDPNELHNLYGEASVATVQAELERRLAV